MIRPDITIPHSVRDWLWLNDRISTDTSARGDEYRDTFLREFPGDEIDLYEIASLEDEYRQREIEEGITSYDLSADEADYQGYSSQWRRR